MQILKLKPIYRAIADLAPFRAFISGHISASAHILDQEHIEQRLEPRSRARVY